MPTLTIYLHAEGPPDLETSDAATLEAVRSAYPEPSQLVMAHDLANILRPHHKHWASLLEAEEEAHMVTVVLS